MLNFVQLRGEFVELFGNSRRFRHQRRRVAALLLRNADFLGELIALRLQLFGLSLNRLAFILEFIEFFFRESERARRETGHHVGKLLTQHIDVEHYGTYSFVSSRIRKPPYPFKNIVRNSPAFADVLQENCA